MTLQNNNIKVFSNGTFSFIFNYLQFFLTWLLVIMKNRGSGILCFLLNSGNRFQLLGCSGILKS